jgi:GntR family transcriptional repressor for pyruvate dehydrogenase complex
MDEKSTPATNGLQAIGRGRLADRVAVEIRNYIKTNELKPGDRLVPERVLVQELGVGRSSVREALRALSTLGLIEVRQGDGMYVRAPVDGDVPATEPLFDIREQHALRNLVETRLGIEFAAVTAAAARSSQGDLDQLQNMLDQQGRDLARNPDFSWEPLAFELAIVEMTGNTWLHDVELELAKAWRALSKDLRGSVGRYREWHAEHDAILASIRSGNVAQAQRLVLAHLSLERFEQDIAARGRSARARSGRRRRTAPASESAG